MQKLQREDILGLETYAERRPAIRQRMIAHKKKRRLAMGSHVTFQFEDRETMQYQIQEMLRAERIFDREAIQEEIDTYNELIPDGTNWKATLLFEFEDVSVRERELTKLVGIEEQIYVTVGNGARLKVHVNDDMPRSNETKTAAVHFLRFEFSSVEINAMHEGAAIVVEFDHPLMPFRTTMSKALRTELIRDFDH